MRKPVFAGAAVCGKPSVVPLDAEPIATPPIGAPERPAPMFR
jgi:hypothetical protein